MIKGYLKWEKDIEKKQQLVIEHMYIMALMIYNKILYYFDVVKK